LNQSSYTTIKVYDLYGRCVKEIVNSYQDGGVYSVSINASELPGGVYFYELKTEKFSLQRKMLLLK